MAILLVGLNHVTAPVAFRERLYFGGAALRAFVRELCALPGMTEAVVLSTCNRTEVVVNGDDPALLLASLSARAGIAVEELREHLYIYTDRHAVRHLFRVACGLDSLVLGEMQILKQVRDALETAAAEGGAGRQLHGVFQQAIAAGKRARAETGISEGAFSIGRAGVELARAHLPNLAGSPVLLLGAGKMSELTATHLAAHGVHPIFVANRTYAHAEELAARLSGHAIHYGGLDCALMNVDILISSTSAPHLILPAAEVAHVMARRQQRPLCLIDLAVPRDIDPAAGEIPGVCLYNIDDLREVTARDGVQRMTEVSKVDAIIDEEVRAWSNRQAGLEAAAVIAALRASFEEVRRHELDRLIHLCADLTPEQLASMEVVTTSLINKLLHTPTVRLKELLADHPELPAQSLLRDLFALEMPNAAEETLSSTP